MHAAVQVRCERVRVMQGRRRLRRSPLRLSPLALLGRPLGFALLEPPLEQASLQALLLARAAERLVETRHALVLPAPVALYAPPEWKRNRVRIIDNKIK